MTSTLPVPPNQCDLVTTGSGHYAGGTAAAGALEESVGTLNYAGAIASNLMTLMQNTKSKDNGRREHMFGYAAMTFFLPMKSFRRGISKPHGSLLAPYLAKEMDFLTRQCRNEARKNRETTASEKKKKDFHKLKALVQKIWAEMKKKSFKILNKHL